MAFFQNLRGDRSRASSVPSLKHLLFGKSRFKHSLWKHSLWKRSSRRLTLSIIGLTLAGTVIACSNTDTALTDSGSKTAAAPAKTVELTLVSYAVTQSAYEKIIPQFVEQWKAETGQEVVFEQSYGGSGSQTRAVLDGLEADVVALALALDTKKLEEGGLIESGWEKEFPNEAIVTTSVAALVTRDGNPKNIQGWEDLTRDDVQVITANPKTSGGARWNYLALWGHITQNGGDEAAATKYVTEVYSDVPILPKDAREATDVFYQRNQGDVLINYENEVLLAAQKGEKQPYIIPDVNISIENPVAVVDANVDRHGNREVAEAFVKFLFTPAAQREFAKVGFRSVDTDVSKEFTKQYPKISKLFTVADLGGWEEVQKKFFADGASFDKIQAKVGKR